MQSNYSRRVTERLSPEQDRLAVSVVRGIAMDAPFLARSGHQGTAMALAPLGHVLYSRVMRHDPSTPNWVNRDRFVLSNGHASILQYALLALCGYGIERHDLLAFRSWGSQTPGHPEVGVTAGVEVTTGPLGQGLANAVGMAIAERHLREVHGPGAVDHHTWVMAGDGCLMEGISHEAASLAGHLGLDRLVCIFDDNRITIDGSTDLTCSDDVPARFRAYGWTVIEAGEPGDDLNAIESVLLEARASRGKPVLCTLRTRIGYPSPDLTDRHEAHGNPFTAEQIARTKALMGIPDDPLWMPDELVVAYRSAMAERGRRFVAEHQRSSTGTDVALLDGRTVTIDRVRAALPAIDNTKPQATRQSLSAAIDATASVLPELLIGSADLTSNTGVKAPSLRRHSATDPGGQQIYFGIREHAMGAALVGMALHGSVLPVGGTFLVFADYMRPSIRLAALSHARVVFVFSHDSVGVGEDGPTHQPVEQLASLRAIPGLQVIRPADAAETHEAWLVALSHNGPTALILSRQNLPHVTDGTAVETGAGILRDVASPMATIVATGSEVHVGLLAADELLRAGINVRVLSMPSWERFAVLPPVEQRRLLGDGVPVLSVEAGSTFGWARWADASVGIDRFGASAPGEVVMERLGISVAAVAEALRVLLADKARQ
jgi:transketolase